MRRHRQLPLIGFALALTLAHPAGADPLATILEHRAANAADAERSEGCGSAPPGPAPDTLEVGGRERRLITSVPDPYDPDQPHALVIAFHGRTSPAEKVRRYYDLERHATRPTIFVYPQALPAGPSAFAWSDPGDAPDELRDYALFDAIVRRFDAAYCIDRGRIFAVGHSLGAWFANSLACARGDVLRGIGTVGGSISAGECRGRLAAIVIHNPLDQLVPFAFGLEVRDRLRADGAAGVGELAEHATFSCLRYGHPDGPHPLLWCPHHHHRTATGRPYPHQWPDGAGEAIMRFFEALPEAA